MLEALWSVEFVSNTDGEGAGVAVLETGRILGGDGQYYYDASLLHPVILRDRSGWLLLLYSKLQLPGHYVLCNSGDRHQDLHC